MLDQLTADLRTARDELAAQRDDLDRQIAAVDQALDALEPEPARPAAPRPAKTRAKRGDPRKGRKIPAPDGGPFTCGCGRDFTRPNGLSRHIRESHGGRAPAPAAAPTPSPPLATRVDPATPIVPTVISWADSRGAAGRADATHQCDRCGAEFRTNIRLRQHQANAHKAS